MWASRKWDSFGVGIYHYGWSQGLSTALLTDVGPETGFEVFYNFAVTPWLIVTPDIQVIAPATAEADVFAVLGLRTVVKF
jgi:porin